MTMGVINAVAQFERDLLIERTQSGLARAKANGKTLGRPQILAELQKKTGYTATTRRQNYYIYCKTF
ncbi:MAG: recombinase family protein [Rickettsia endosymbiont of Ixodes persulcatus]|nr:recombinase family protein [Rickettsia endosymbiont of Ixodes persulcatus]MCZ6910095.1 recombinase family protein [Rickettsia endosymbiont of Ixodes persulcatus]